MSDSIEVVPYRAGRNLHFLSAPLFKRAQEALAKVFHRIRNEQISSIKENKLKGIGLMGPTHRSPWEKGFWFGPVYISQLPKETAAALEEVLRLPYLRPYFKLHIFGRDSFNPRGYYPHLDVGVEKHLGTVPGSLVFCLQGGGEHAVTSWYAVRKERSIDLAPENNAYATVEDPFEGFDRLDSYTLQDGDVCIFNSSRYHAVDIDYEALLVERVTVGLSFDRAVGSYEDIVNIFLHRGWILDS